MPQTASVEAEIIDENGQVLVAQDSSGQNQTAYQPARAGLMTGFVALAFSFIMMLFMAVVTLFILFPLMLLGRILGLQIKTFRR